MATQDQESNTDAENKHIPNPHEHPQNASGKAGKEISSDQNETDFDQSTENESLDQLVHTTQSQLNPTTQAYHERNPKVEEPTKEAEISDDADDAESDDAEIDEADNDEDEKTASAPSEKDPVDRPIKDENGELL